jgi:hypothetical protein
MTWIAKHHRETVVDIQHDILCAVCCCERCGRCERSAASIISAGDCLLCCSATDLLCQKLQSYLDGVCHPQQPLSDDADDEESLRQEANELSYRYANARISCACVDCARSHSCRV